MILKNTRRNAKSSVERFLLFVILRVYVNEQKNKKNDANNLCRTYDSYELKWVGENYIEEFKNKCEDFYMCSNLNRDIMKHECKLQTLKLSQRIRKIYFEEYYRYGE